MDSNTQKQFFDLLSEFSLTAPTYHLAIRAEGLLDEIALHLGKDVFADWLDRITADTRKADDWLEQLLIDYPNNDESKGGGQ